MLIDFFKDNLYFFHDRIKSSSSPLSPPLSELLHHLHESLDNNKREHDEDQDNDTDWEGEYSQEGEDGDDNDPEDAVGELAEDGLGPGQDISYDVGHWICVI